jgi:hypothetical protein
MTFQDFLEKWNGQPVDFDGIYPNQCMDLMHQYVYDVLGLTDAKILAHPSACQVFDNFTETDYFDKIANSPTGVPKEGDIVVFKCVSALPYGHVCIFIEGDTNSFRSFDANWPTGSLPHVQNHTSYGYCAGWLHPKTVIPDLQAQIDQLRADRDRNWEWFVSVCNALKTGANVDTAVAEATKLLTIEQAVLDKDRQLAEVQKQAIDLQAQLDLKVKAIDEAQAQALTLTVEIGKLQQAVDSLTKQTTEEQQQIKDLSDAAKITQSLTGFRKILFNWLFRG